MELPEQKVATGVTTLVITSPTPLKTSSIVSPPSSKISGVSKKSPPGTVGTESSAKATKDGAKVIPRTRQELRANPLISGALKIIKSQNVSVGEYVLCIFLVNGGGDGFVIGGYG